MEVADSLYGISMRGDGVSSRGQPAAAGARERLSGVPARPASHGLARLPDWGRHGSSADHHHRHRRRARRGRRVSCSCSSAAAAGRRHAVPPPAPTPARHDRARHLRAPARRAPRAGRRRGPGHAGRRPARRRSPPRRPARGRRRRRPAGWSGSAAGWPGPSPRSARCCSACCRGDKLDDAGLGGDRGHADHRRHGRRPGPAAGRAAADRGQGDRHRSTAEVRALLRADLLEPSSGRTWTGRCRPAGTATAPRSCWWSASTAPARPPPAGKLARVLIGDGRTVLLGAADTFRAAAADQLQTWGDAGRRRGRAVRPGRRRPGQRGVRGGQATGSSAASTP